MQEEEVAAKPKRAVIVAVQLPDVSDVDHQASVLELKRLIQTLGHQVTHVVTQRRRGIHSGVVLGEGKLVELSVLTGGPGYVPDETAGAKAKEGRRERDAARAEDDDAVDPDDEVVAVPAERAPPVCDLVVVDHEISPRQAANLEKASGAPVLDRTGVIVEIFSRHAQTREARLQVEIARLTYVVPRLRAGGGGHNDRQRGGIGGKGAGESAAELDKRKVRDRIAELRQELAEIERDASHRRAGRTGLRRVALVGYTNAGKSSLMRALTGSGVYVADKLFATLDTTVRALVPEVRPRILVSDTVGFIQKLPHDLVASFRSTLDEAHEAGLLLYVVDASDPTFRSQYGVTRSVLSEIGAEAIPSRLVLNKVDRLSPDEVDALRAEYPEAVLISAHAPADVARMHSLIVEFFDKDAEEFEVLVPYDRGQVIGLVHENARVLEERFEDDGTLYRLRAEPAGVAKIKGALGLLPPPPARTEPWE